MATKDQYEFFRSLYDEEERTSLQLEGRAKVYLGIISAFLVTIFLKTDDAIRAF
jgi:preprotein translocase subunit Sec61beta